MKLISFTPLLAELNKASGRVLISFALLLCCAVPCRAVHRFGQGGAAALLAAKPACVVLHCFAAWLRRRRQRFPLSSPFPRPLRSFFSLVVPVSSKCQPPPLSVIADLLPRLVSPPWAPFHLPPCLLPPAGGGHAGLPAPPAHRQLPGGVPPAALHTDGCGGAGRCGRGWGVGGGGAGAVWVCWVRCACSGEGESWPQRGRGRPRRRARRRRRAQASCTPLMCSPVYRSLYCPSLYRRVLLPRKPGGAAAARALPPPPGLGAHLAPPPLHGEPSCVQPAVFSVAPGRATLVG